MATASTSEMEKELMDYLAAVEKDFEDNEATLKQESLEDQAAELAQEIADDLAEHEEPASRVAQFSDWAERYSVARFACG